MKAWVTLCLISSTIAVTLLLQVEYANSTASQNSTVQDSLFSKKHFIAEKWTTENGLPINHINQVYQTPDGFIWLVTYNGLVRFDGDIFREYNSGNTPTLPSNRMIAIQPGTGNDFWINTEQNHLIYFHKGTFTSYEDQLRNTSEIKIFVDDELHWIGTKSGLYLFKNKTLTAFKPDLLGEKAITAIYKSQDGLIHIYDFDGIEWLIDSNLEIIGSRETPIKYGAVAVTEDLNGKIWIARNEIAFLENNTYNRISIPQNYIEKWDDSLHMFISFKITPDGEVLIMGQSGLMKINDDALTAIDFIEYNGYVSYAEVIGNNFTTCPDSSIWTIFRDQVYKNGHVAFQAEHPGETIFCDNEQNLWITTSGSGLYRYRESLFKNITFDHSENVFYGIFQDSYGITWIGSYFKDLTQVQSSGQAFNMKIPSGYGLTATFLETSDGSLWNGYNRCGPENRTESGACHSFEMMTGFEGVGIYALYQDRKNQIWAGTENYLLRWDENFKPGALEKLPIPFVRYFLESEDQEIWMATNGDGIFRYKNGDFTNYTVDEGLSSNNIRALHKDEYGYIWIATEDRGLNRIDPETGKIIVIRKSDGLFEDGLHQMLMDDFGRMWISSNHGIFWIEFNQLHEFASGVRDQVFSISYNENNGMLNREANGGFQNTGFKSGDGHLFFATQKGVVVIDPNKIKGRSPIHPVIIEDLTSSGYPLLNGSKTTTLNADQRSFTIQYNSPFFLATGRIQFRYKLEGFDNTWIDAGSRREANYTNIPAGKYTFKVSANLGDGGNETIITSHALVIAPYFYETHWFPISLFLLLFLLIGGGYQMRLRNLLRKEKTLEKLVLMRTEDLRTEKLKTEAQAEQLKILAREKNRFFTNISHEFRTPLTLTIGPLKDLRDGKYGILTPVARQQADLSLRNARRLLRLVGQLMDLARLEDQKFELKLESGDLCRYLRTVAEPFKIAAKQKQISFSILMPKEPLITHFDPAQFDKILANILSNSFKFTPEGGTITLQLIKKSNENIIRVNDTGCGIESEHLPRLFDRFYQLQKSEMQPGSGIGLSLAKEFTELHGGKIDVESKINEGSTFTIRLPIYSDDPKTVSAESCNQILSENLQKYTLFDHKIQNIKKDDSNTDENREMLKTILIVDDHADIRTYMKQHLEKTYNIIEAASGNEANNILNNHLPDLIISDVMMPDGDGFSLLKEIRNNSETNFLPVILLTARAEIEDRLSGLGIGANDYITKPFNMQEVLVRLRNMFEQQKRFRHHLTNGKMKNMSEIHHDLVKLESADQFFLKEVKMTIQSDLSDENFSVEELAAKVNQSRSNLHRRLTKLTGETPSALIRRIRLELGAQLLLQNAGTVSEIAYSIGFKNVAHFSRVFREQFHQSPTEYSAAMSDTKQLS